MTVIYKAYRAHCIDIVGYSVELLNSVALQISFHVYNFPDAQKLKKVTIKQQINGVRYSLHGVA